MIVDIVDKYCTNDNNPIKNLRLENLGKFATKIKNYLENSVLMSHHRQDGLAIKYLSRFSLSKKQVFCNIRQNCSGKNVWKTKCLLECPVKNAT
jgi:hypothetical protein